MPSHKIHLALAKKVNEKLNYDLDSILIGSVLPDICEGRNHGVSHFQKGKTDLAGLANPDRFIEKYKDKLDNPVMMGYLIHILSDRFYNEYFFRHFYIYDDNNNGIGMYLKGRKKILGDNDRKALKHRELALYDKWLLNHNQVPRFKSLDCLNNIVNIEEATFDKENIKNYINNANRDIDKNNMFSKLCFYNYKITNKKELDEIFNNCVNYIIDYVKKIR